MVGSGVCGGPSLVGIWGGQGGSGSEGRIQGGGGLGVVVSGVVR